MEDVRHNSREAFQAPLVAASAAEARRHDFRRPTESLQQLGDVFADGLSKSLSAHLRCGVRVVAGSIEQLPYHDFLLALEPTTCIGVLRVDPPGAQACIDLPRQLIDPMIERLLGGRGPGRRTHAMTEIERGMALQIIERAATQLAQSWSEATGGELSVREESLESNPASLRIMPADEIVTVARFEVTLGDADGTDAGGTMSLCVPEPVVQQLLDSSAALLSPLPRAGESSRAARKQEMTRNVLQAAVALRALLAETKVRLSDVLAMQVGDVITTEKPADAAVEMEGEGGQTVAGQLGQLHGMRAVRVTRPAAASDGPRPGGELA